MIDAARRARRRARLVAVWVTATIAVSAMVCGGVVALNQSQQEALDRYTRTISEFRQARIDLYQGFLHVSLDTRDAVPWNRSQGIGLLNQALATFDRLVVQLPLDSDRTWEFADQVRGFRTVLMEGRRIGADVRYDVELRVAFHSLDSMLYRLDAAARARLHDIQGESRSRFRVVLGLAGALLVMISIGLVLAARRLAAADVAQVEIMRRARADLDRFEKIFTASPAATAIVGLDDGLFLAVNDAYLRLNGCAREDLIGRPAVKVGMWIDEVQRNAFVARLRGGERVLDQEIKLRLHSGEIRDGMISADIGEFMEQPCILSIVTDITDRKRYEAHIEYLATHDGLTGLPNRALARDRLNQAIAHAQRAGSEGALLFVDIDRFKSVNEGFGHAVGDALLRAVGQRLAALLDDGDTVARQSGDEFLVVLVSLNAGTDAYATARAVLDAIAQPFAIGSVEVLVRASVGLAVFPQDGDDADALIVHADAAMARAKAQGGNLAQFFTSGMSEEAKVRFDLETGLRAALGRAEFSLVYQPKADIATGEIIGCEALIRWNHPTMGVVPPARFIPLAEETGLIVPIGDWVLRTACAQAQAWRARGLPEVVVSVNLSVRQFLQPDVEGWVLDALRVSGLPPELLELELTESLIAQDSDRVVATVDGLKAAGVRISIDDFGTGYSSLSYLSRFHVDTLKIDQSFVRNMLVDPADATIVRAVISLARALKMTAIAEGVETIEHLHFLRENRCDAIQGYYFSRPVAPEDFALMLRDRKRLAS
jgi:diguanylate cyclase (GGDEF)-like protein/PAS domain S-box-containing protein